MRPFVAVATALTAATWLVAGGERWEPAGTDLLGEWDTRRQGGDVSLAGDAATLTVDGCAAKEPCFVVLSQVVPRHDAITVSAVLAGAGPSAGLYVAARNAAGKRLAPGWIPARVSGPSGVHRSTIRPPRGAADVEVRLALAGHAGTLVARDVRARPARERNVALVRAVQLGWIGLFAGVAGASARAARSRGLAGLAVVAGAGVVAATLAPVGGLLPASLPVDDVGHAVLLLVLAAIADATWPDLPRRGLGLRLLGFAAVTEVLQGFTADRAPELRDFAADALGIVLGIGSRRAWAALRRPKDRVVA